jgi:N-acetylglucosaminyldiphosphoundecaprenol N-acetyl-beta-D-mannosaminyltransferase
VAVLPPVTTVLPQAATRKRRPKYIPLLNCRIDKLTYADAIGWVKCFLSGKQPSQIITANPLMLLAAQKDEELAEIIEEAALVVPESSGIKWASEQSGTPLDEFVPGIDLFLGMCKLARDLNQSIYLLGGRPGVAEKAAAALGAKIPGLRIAGTHHGYFPAGEDPGVVAQIRDTAPGLLFVGMSVPHQEKWIHRNLEALGVPAVMGVGGSFDVFSGRLRRAPAWMRELGFEWLFRTLQEPWRFKRIVHLPVFVYKILTQ